MGKIGNRYVCEYCGSDYKYELGKNGKPKIIFCSQECCDNYNQENKRYTRCKNCNKEFQTIRYMSGKYNRSLFCCKECETEYNIKQNPTRQAICKNCGKTFEQHRRENNTFTTNEFCCNLCASEYRKNIPIGYDKCKECGKIFKQGIYDGCNKVKQDWFCSEKCNKAYHDKKYKTTKYNKCKQCGKIFALKQGMNDKRIFCSEECLKKFEYESRLQPQMCKFCSGYFIPKRTPSGRRSKSVFCSDDCWLGYWQQLNEEKYGVPYTFMLNNKHLKISKQNLQFAELLKRAQIKFEYEFDKIEKENKYFYSYDFYLPDYNLLVEINPTFSHSTVSNCFNWSVEKEYHYNKTKLAKQNGYNCICIWDWDDKEAVVQAIKENTLKILNGTVINKHWNKINTKDHIQDNGAQNEQEMISEGYLPVFDDGQMLIY